MINYRTLALALLGGLTLGASAQQPQAQPSPAFAIVQADDLKWTDIPSGQGAQFTMVRGDASKPGLYVMRVRFPPHVMDLPHAHSKDRHVTVISGTWHAGTGTTFEPANATPVKAGGYMFHPANGVHWDGSASDEEAMVQIIGEGPVATTQLHGAGPDWVKVPKR